jgi:hypothetical protein
VNPRAPTGKPRRRIRDHFTIASHNPQKRGWFCSSATADASSYGDYSTHTSCEGLGRRIACAPRTQIPPVTRWPLLPLAGETLTREGEALTRWREKPHAPGGDVFRWREIRLPPLDRFSRHPGWTHPGWTTAAGPNPARPLERSQPSTI